MKSDAISYLAIGALMFALLVMVLFFSPSPRIADTEPSGVHDDARLIALDGDLTQPQLTPERYEFASAQLTSALEATNLGVSDIARMVASLCGEEEVTEETAHERVTMLVAFFALSETELGALVSTLLAQNDIRLGLLAHVSQAQADTIIDGLCMSKPSDVFASEVHAGERSAEAREASLVASREYMRSVFTAYNISVAEYAAYVAPYCGRTLTEEEAHTNLIDTVTLMGLTEQEIAALAAALASGDTTPESLAQTHDAQLQFETVVDSLCQQGA